MDGQETTQGNVIFKMPADRRKYFADVQRKRRIGKHKCAVCGEQAYAKILLTQEPRCAKHLVAPLKEELTKQIPKEKQISQPKTPNAPSVANQTTEASSAPIAAT